MIADRPSQIWFETETDARAVLDALRKLVAQRGYATLSDFLELIGVQPTYGDAKIGWTNLSGQIDLVRNPQAEWGIAMPEIQGLR